MSSLILSNKGARMYDLFKKENNEIKRAGYDNDSYIIQSYSRIIFEIKSYNPFILYSFFPKYLILSPVVLWVTL